MTWHTNSASARATAWSGNLNPEQRAAVRTIVDADRFMTHKSGGGGYTVTISPTTQPAKRVELRKRLVGGEVLRWRIDPDGTTTRLEGRIAA